MAMRGEGPAKGLPGYDDRHGQPKWVAEFDQLEQSTMPDHPGVGNCSAALIAGAGLFGLVALGLLAAQ